MSKIKYYFDSLTKDDGQENIIELTSLVESLCGLIELPEDFDLKKAKAEHILLKYK